MISVSEAKKLISSRIVTLNPITIGIENACGYILAADVYGICDIPLYQQSAMDGYALKFKDHQKTLQLVGEMAAGTEQELTIETGETSRIFTGAPLPAGADTIVMQEKTTCMDGKVKLNDPLLKLGANVRDKGSEIKAGELALNADNLITPAAIGFLAGIGITEIKVYPMPKIAIIVTGNELQKPGLPLHFGQVYESNSYALIAALKLELIDEIKLFHADDNLEILTKILNEALNFADVVLLTGGVSVGDYDFVIEASKRCQIEQIFHKVKQKPGKPLFFGTKGSQLVFGLPGNPSSVLSCYYNYVLPALTKLSHKENSVKEVKAVLTNSYNKPASLTHFLKGHYQNGKVTPLNAQESFRLSSFAQANCLICLAEEEESFTKGNIVNVLLLPN